MKSRGREMLEQEIDGNGRLGFVVNKDLPRWGVIVVVVMEIRGAGTETTEYNGGTRCNRVLTKQGLVSG